MAKPEHNGITKVSLKNKQEVSPQWRTTYQKGISDLALSESVYGGTSTRKLRAPGRTGLTTPQLPSSPQVVGVSIPSGI